MPRDFRGLARCQGGGNQGQGGYSGATYNYYGDGHHHYHGQGDYTEGGEEPYLKPGFIREPEQEYMPSPGRDPFFDGYQHGLAAAKKKYGR